jgi:hypothetical protein
VIAIAVAASGIALSSTSDRDLVSARPSAADTFMHSVARRDGRQVWLQLCPEAQREVPVEALVEETDALRATDGVYDMTVSMDFVRAEPLPEGGERRTYLASAHQSGATVIQKTFVVRTQASGCVQALE